MKTYLLSIVAAAFLVSILASVPQNKPFMRILRLCGGLYLLIVVLKPLLSLNGTQLSTYLEQFRVDTSVIEDSVEEGKMESAKLIKEQTKEYILDKADAIGASVAAEVELQTLSDTYPYPYCVTLTGTWTQTQKKALEEYISQTLGIPEERQIWNKTE